MLASLTAAQVAQIPLYRERWLQLANSTEPLDQQAAIAAIEQTYRLAGIACPQIVWCNSPYTALMYLWKHLSPDGQTHDMGVPVAYRLANQLEFQLDLQLSGQLEEALVATLVRGEGDGSWGLDFPLPHWQWWLLTELRQQVGAPWWLVSDPCVLDVTTWMRRASWMDFCHSVLGCYVDQARWQTFQRLLQSCSWIVAYEQVCLVCDRPSRQTLVTTPGLAGTCWQRDYRDGYSLTAVFASHDSGATPPEDVTMTLPSTSEWQVLMIPAKQESHQALAHLSPLQQAQLPAYRSRWRQQVLQTQPIDSSQAIAAIQAAYAAIGRTPPEIRMFSSPHTAFAHLQSLSDLNQLGLRLDGRLEHQLLCQLGIQLEQQISPSLKFHIIEHLKEPLLALQWQVQGSLGEQFLPSTVFNHGWFVQPDHWACEASVLDFCISELGCDHDRARWAVVQNLIQSCGWFFPMEQVCLLCDRPSHIRLDADNHLHAEGEPALQFADGSEVRYVYHGVRLPAQYGTLPPQQWQVRWLLQESNAELRRVLIQGIGYGRICQELQATDLDTWREYTLLQLEEDIDQFDTADIPEVEPEPIHLLKMTCPSTGAIHAVRVPPHIRSAREAIRWVNWDIDPEEFSAET